MRPRTILITIALLAVGTITAIPVQASPSASALQPRSLARAQTIRGQIDARYRVLLGRGLAQPLYLLSDAFAAHDAAKALELLDRLLGDGEAGLRVLVTLHRALRQVRSAVALREAGLTRAQIGAKLLPPNMQFKVDALYDASRRWSEADLVHATAQLTKIDREIKQGADEAVALAAAIAAACGTRATTSPRRAS